MTALCRECGAPLRLPYDPPRPGSKLHKTALRCVDCWAVPDVRSEHERRLTEAQKARKGERRTSAPTRLRSRNVQLETVMSEWAALRDTMTPDEVARALRMNYDAFRRAIYRAAAAGDPRARDFPGRHGVLDPSRQVRTSIYDPKRGSALGRTKHAFAVAEAS